LGEVFAPELISQQGRIGVISTYIVLCVAAIYGVMNVKIDFKVNFFISDDTYAGQYLNAVEMYFNEGFQATFYVENDELDFTSKEVQI